MIDFKLNSKVILEWLLSDEIRPRLKTFVKTSRDKTIIPSLTPMAPYHSGSEITLLDQHTKKSRLFIANDGKKDPSTFKSTIKDTDK